MPSATATPLPTITITPTPDIPPQTRKTGPVNPLWIFCNNSLQLSNPKLGAINPVLSTTNSSGLLSPSWGTVQSETEPIRLNRVVLVTPIPEVDSLNDSITVGLTAEKLVEVCDAPSGRGGKAEVGDLAEGVLMHEGTHLRYGMGKVVAVLEDVMVFMVRKGASMGC
ncbi:hypothetical protein BDV06DRAFT_220333 [Aspergillus oleicola]